MLTIKEVAQKVGVLRQTVLQWIKKGWLKAEKVPKQGFYYMIDEEELKRFIEERMTEERNEAFNEELKETLEYLEKESKSESRKGTRKRNGKRSKDYKYQEKKHARA
jgi:excisionase family DNA binding protein